MTCRNLMSCLFSGRSRCNTSGKFAMDDSGLESSLLVAFQFDQQQASNLQQSRFLEFYVDAEVYMMKVHQSSRMTLQARSTACIVLTE